MKTKKGGFTFVEVLLVIAILGILAGLLMPAISKLRNEAKVREQHAFGRVIDEPTVDQKYLTMAVDTSGVNEVIAMPWEYANDGAVMTDRRVLLTVDSNICAKGAGTWFVRRVVTSTNDSLIATESNLILPEATK